MGEEIKINQSLSREDKYLEIHPQIEALIEPEDDFVANLANISAVLKEVFGFFWVGFYRVGEEDLVLGPFQGPVACTRISFQKGVCGVAFTTQKSILVPNVENFPDHIACSALTKSEVVIPLVIDEKVKLILDIDSDRLSDFSELDIRELGKIMILIQKKHFK